MKWHQKNRSRKKMQQKLKSYYPKVSLITISAVYLLILVGGIVRSTGAGMGCPDWPKCFGEYIPPTSVEELPSDYKEQYSALRARKNKRLASMLTNMGFDQLAYKITNDKSILEEADFNATKTWIEYVNRLIGAVIGLLILITVVFSSPYLKTNSRVFWISFSALILVGFQGWVGSLVVSTNLLPGMITFHMLLALVLVAVLIYGYYTSLDKDLVSKVDAQAVKIRSLLVISMVLYLIQVAFGTKVREMVDQIAILFPDSREVWISELGIEFYLHRSYSIVILGIHVYLAYLLLEKAKISGTPILLIKFIVVLIALEILSGALMAYLAIPSILQPVHLLVASLIFGAQFYLFCVMTNPVKLMAKAS